MVAKSFPRKQVYRKIILEKNFLSKIFYDCKIISWKTGLQEKNFWEKCFGRNFLWLQNHFLENRFTGKSFLRKIFCRNFFMIAKSFPGKQVSKKKMFGKVFGRNFFMVAKSFPRKQVCKKKN